MYGSFLIVLWNIVSFTYSYLNTVADAFSDPLVGGSPQCLQVVSEGHARVGELLKTADGRAQIAELFNICGGLFLNRVFLWLHMHTSMLFYNKHYSVKHGL